MSTTVKADLHRLVDQLNDDDAATARRLLTALLEDDPVGLSLALAPPDDEPVTDEDLAALDEAYEDRQAGRTLTTEELRRELGL